MENERWVKELKELKEINEKDKPTASPQWQINFYEQLEESANDLEQSLDISIKEGLAKGLTMSVKKVPELKLAEEALIDQYKRE